MPTRSATASVGFAALHFDRMLGSLGTPRYAPLGQPCRPPPYSFDESHHGLQSGSDERA
jgi:hypothetical protein